MEFLLFFAIVSIVVHEIEGFGGGAPPYKCGDMIPSHGPNQPQLSLPPYTLTANSNTYQQGETITVILQSPVSSAFRGYLITAKDSDTLNTIHGTFVNAATGKTLPCGSSGSGAITHQSRDSEFSLQVQWQPTADTRGSIVFIATALESYGVFWTNILSDTIYPRVVTTQPPVVTTPIPVFAPVITTAKPPVVITTTKAAETTSSSIVTTETTKTDSSTSSQLTGSVDYDKECGSTKGCFVDCTGNTCNYIVTWRDNGNVVDFELATKLADTNDKYIAIAFSSDAKMGGDEVVSCFNVGGNTDIQRSYNDGYSNVPVTDKKVGISNEVVTVQNGVFKCSFTKSKKLTRTKRQASTSLFVDLERDYNVMFATGPAYQGNFVGKHTSLPPVTPSKVDFQSFEIIGDTAKYPLVKIHACLMIIAWIFCTCVAIIAARHYKPVWSKSSLFSQKIWFQIHRTLMVTATILTIISFIIIFVEVGGYSKVSSTPGKEYLPSHPVLGIIVTILCIINPIMSVFRPGPTDKTRPIFNWAHWGVGMLAQILAILTIIFGVEMQKSTAPKYTVWVVVGFVIYYVLMEITQKVVDKLAERREGGDNIDAVEMKQNGSSNGSSYSMTQPPPYSEVAKKNMKDTLLKKSLLALHVICTLAFTLTLLLLVSMY